MEIFLVIGASILAVFSYMAIGMSVLIQTNKEFENVLAAIIGMMLWPLILLLLLFGIGKTDVKSLGDRRQN